MTLPLILARERDSGLAALDLRRAVSDEASAAEVCDRIAETGALEEARKHALRFVAAAKQELRAIKDIGERQRSLLELVADGVVERYA